MLMVALSVTTLMMVACDREEPNTGKQPTMAVTYTTLDGVWQLIELDGGSLDEATYLYLDIDGKQHRITIYDNIGSMYTQTTTGEFSIEYNQAKEYIISGRYDNGVGAWNDSYKVTLLASGEEMLWCSITTGEQTLYKRVEALPEF